MQTSNPLDPIPLWLLYGLMVGLLFLSAEAGYHAGRAWRRRAPDEDDGPTGAMTGATLALLAFLLAFITGVGVSRFDNRRQLVINEANSIGTTYLRAGYLSDPQRGEIRDLLREYVDLRLADEADVDAARLRSEEIHNELWSRTIAVAQAEPTPVTSLFISSLNEMIDIHGERIFAILNTRLPPALELGIFLAAFLAMAMVGFQNGLKGARSIIPLIALILIFSAVMLLIVDLDRPTEGFMRVNQQALIDLQTTLNTAPPP
jgi:hypothetical protein